MKLRAPTTFTLIHLTVLIGRYGVAGGHAPSKKTARDFLVEGLADIEPAFGSFDGDMYAGVLPVDPRAPLLKDSDEDENDQGGHLMFWSFEPVAPDVDDSLVFWFNGGPGCSSFDAGMLFEMSPVTAEQYLPAGYYAGLEERNQPLRPNRYAWTNASNIVFIEQPVGVGFSYGGKAPHRESDVARDFYGFLRNFYKIFPNQRSKRLFLVGESYAGHYIPAIARYIHHRNKAHKRSGSDDKVNLAGIGIGNGWIDAAIQGPVVIDYAWWHGMIDSYTRDALKTEWENCYPEDGNPFTAKQPKPFHSFTVPDECGIMGKVLEAAGANLFPWGGPNTYDVTTWDPYALLTEQSTPTKFFNNPDVQKALHAPKGAGAWSGCIPGAGRRRLQVEEEENKTASNSNISSTSLRAHRQLILEHDVISVVPYMAELLDDAGIPVLVYSGDRDLSTCVQGSEMALDGMEWSGAKAWADPHVFRRGVWVVDNYVAGYSKTVKNLEFVVVYNSGHMVPTNQPAAALDLIKRLLTAKTFVDKAIPVVYEPPKTVSKPHHCKEFQVATQARDQLARWMIGAFSFAGGLVISQLFGRFMNRKHREYQSIDL